MSSSPQCCASATSTLVPATLRGLRNMNLWRCEIIMDGWRTEVRCERRMLEFPWKNSNLVDRENPVVRPIRSQT